MAELTERVQVLLAPEHVTRLRNLAKREDRSVGALIREALEATYFRQDRAKRMAAVRRIAEMDLPVADWEQMERESIRWPADEA